MNRRYHTARKSRIFGGILAIAVALLTGLPLAAAELVKVRVGAHADYTRVVFELDRAVGYRVERTGTAKAPMLRVTLDAASKDHQVGAHGDVRGLKIGAGSKTVAEIPLRRGDLRLQEMMLSNPPRIVLDLKSPDPVAGVEPKPEAKTAAAPKPAPKVVAQAPVPTPKQTAKATPKADPKPAPKAAAPKVVATPKVEPKPAPAAKPVQPEVAKVEPAPKTQAKPDPKTASPMATVPATAPKFAANPTEPKAIAKPKSDSPLPAVLPPNERKRPTTVAKPARPTPKKPALPAPAARPKKPESREAKQEGWFARLTGDPLMLGALAGGLVALLGIGATLRRRSRALPSDLDVNAIAEELDDEGDGAAQAEAREGASEESPFGDLFSTPPVDQPTVDSPVPQVQSDLPAEPMAAEPLSNPEFDVEVPSDPSAVSDSIFDEASQGETPMNQDMDLPADPNLAASPPPTMGAGVDIGGAANSDVSQMLEAFERRMQGLEAKLEQANEAREKLERQVAAQSEELRVQRAAIARTQRALRTMSRGDEEKATEPALRDGDTQTKTRISE